MPSPGPHRRKQISLGSKAEPGLNRPAGERVCDTYYRPPAYTSENSLRVTLQDWTQFLNEP